jgi:hypothetical protein
MRAAFDEELQQRKQGEDWIFVFALLGFLVCGGVAAFLPKFVCTNCNLLCQVAEFLVCAGCLTWTKTT